MCLYATESALSKAAGSTYGAGGEVKLTFALYGEETFCKSTVKN